MPLIRHADSRRTETPNALMTTLASPTQGGAGHSVWRVDMRPGQAGPLHAIDTEQVWTVLDGSATVELDGEAHTVGPGDTLVVSLDVDGYNGMDDDRQAAMKRAVLERWRTLWAQAHPHEHAIVRVRFADFIGRTWAEESAPV